MGKVDTKSAKHYKTFDESRWREVFSVGNIAVGDSVIDPRIRLS